MRLSIIIPAYKVADYIEKCIRSLEQQDLPAADFEIIVTNDGSPDNSSEIVRKLQTEFSNLTLIDQENQGVSMARNNAIAKAKGKYILPIDPDDYVLPNTLNRLLTIAENDNLDVFYLGFEIFDAAGKSIWHTNYELLQDKKLDGVEGYFASRGSGVIDPDRSVGMFFKREILEQFQIDYPKDVPYLEDGLFLAKFFAVAQKVGFDNERFYQRTTRAGSATNSRLFYSEKALQGFIKAIEDIKSFGEKHSFEHQQKLLINHVVAKFTLLPLTSLIGQKSLKNYYAFIERLKTKKIHKILNEGLRFDYGQMARIYNQSALLFYLYYPISCKLKTYKR
ncbi:glycosyltransferase [Flavobacterium sp. CYK-4]|uniref:glycosyltransferase family 2 protein n=1 Tax=Flavobacterium lotistagni TaxID=2709660 RepID=UPI0014093B35|nr:glycosyltransferase [Flavobacterium lotistagni]NHM06450.1 glycosyltransferase [Flavobacterium lotistagni]